MPVCSLRNLIGSVALGLALAMVAPADAGEALQCRVSKAPIFRIAGDRYRKQGNYAEAARWYLAAARLTDSCQAPSEAILTARSLAQAGAALAQAGNTLDALTLLHAAQTRLLAVSSPDPQATATAQAFLTQVQNVISAIDDVAQSSM